MTFHALRQFEIPAEICLIGILMIPPPAETAEHPLKTNEPQESKTS
jgi:hypothetical protein